MVLAIACATSALPAPAVAQGFFEQLFGLSPKQKPMQSLTVPPGQTSLGAPRTPGGSVFPAREDGTAPRTRGEGNANGGGTYRTLCVRTCDGYYFPISNSVTKRDFQRDQAKCKSTCGGEARLFTTPNSMSVKPNESVEAMVDLNGLAYTRLAMAFKYRKTLVAGCQCKPEPWSETELDRHRRYAEADLRSKPGHANAIVASAGPHADEKKIASFASPSSGPKTTSIAGAAPVDAPIATLAINEMTETPLSKAPGEKAAKRSTRSVSTPEPRVDTQKRDRAAVAHAKAARRPVEVAWTSPPASAPAPLSMAKSGGLFGGGMGLGVGGGKYAWPGDGARR
jgi:Protein of unknown function (DUF2865)